MKTLLLTIVSLLIVSKPGFVQNSQANKLPEEINSYYSNYNYLSSLKAGVVPEDSTRPSQEEIRLQMLEATEKGKYGAGSVMSPDHPGSKAAVTATHDQLKIENYKISDDEIVVYLRSYPLRSHLAFDKNKPFPSSAQIHRWNWDGQRWVRELNVIQKL